MAEIKQEDGYELTDAVFHAESNDTGNFTLDYQNSQGEWANVQGSMNDGQLDELKKTDPGLTRGHE